MLRGVARFMALAEACSYLCLWLTVHQYVKKKGIIPLILTQFRMAQQVKIYHFFKSQKSFPLTYNSWLEITKDCISTDILYVSRSKDICVKICSGKSKKVQALKSTKVKSSPFEGPFYRLFLCKANWNSHNIIKIKSNIIRMLACACGRRQTHALFN